MTKHSVRIFPGKTLPPPPPSTHTNAASIVRTHTRTRKRAASIVQTHTRTRENAASVVRTHTRTRKNAVTNSHKDKGHHADSVLYKQTQGQGTSCRLYCTDQHKDNGRNATVLYELTQGQGT